MGMDANILTDPMAAMLLAGFAGFAAIMALALPPGPNARLAERMRLVARERDRLRERRLSDLAARGRKRVRRGDSGMLASLARRLKPGERAGSDDGLPARMRMAGYRGASAEALFLFARTAAPLVLFLAAFSAFLLSARESPPVSTALIFALAAAAIGYSLPRIVLDKLIARRQRAISRAFPDALDLLLICVQSGMSIEAALGKVTKDIAAQSIELAEELSLTMAELSYLPSRWRAYANLGERIGLPAVKLITTALVQAERHGASISQALTAAAREGREARIAEAERKAAALPPKLTVPLVVFFLPVLLVIILAPALMQASDALRQHKPAVTGAGAQLQGISRQDARTTPPSPALRQGP
jgi:tight adherence protein C